MSGSFSSFGTALSALNHNRVLMDIANSNIANAGTAGYARRRAEAETLGGPAQAAMWSRQGIAGEGVKIAEVQRVTDEFLNSRSRVEHGNNSYLSTVHSVLARFETTLGEPGDNGVGAALDEFRTGWHDLSVTPGGLAARSQLLDRAGVLVESIATQSRGVSQEISDQRARGAGYVGEVNTLAADLADTNRAIAVATFSGTDSNLLLDQRDSLTMRLSQLTGAVATVRADGGADVTINGTALVTGAEAGELQFASGATDGPMTFQISNAGTSTAVAGAMRGELGAVADVVSSVLPDYRASLDAVVVQLADLVNTQHALGFDQVGDAGGAFFAYDAADPSGTLSIAVTDPEQIAASSVPGGGHDGGNATALATTGGVQDSYQRLVNSLGSEVASVKRLAANQHALTSQVDGSREQLAGVSYDEEMLNLAAAQRGYEAASRVLTTLDSMLDTLINRTGLVGR